MNDKNKIEALLFASAKRMTVEEISNITGLRDLDNIRAALTELKNDFEARGASMILNEENGFWKLTVKDHYMPMLQKILSQAELDKPLMETLAVIAWKYPVLQADVVKIRHNKAYDHLRELEEIGFIARIRYGRTNKITLTDKFFTYFDLPTKEQAKEVFKNIVPDKVKEKVMKAEAEIDEAEKRIEEEMRRREEMKRVKGEETKKAKEKIASEKAEVPAEEVQAENVDEVVEIQKEVENVNVEVPEVQKSDEISEPDSNAGKQE